MLLIDTELLLVLAVGAADPSQIPRWNRTSAYSEQDFHALNRYAGTFHAVAVTPNVLTEASNWAGYLSGKFRDRVFHVLGALFEQFTEYYVPSREIVQHATFFRLGLTDVSILLASKFALTVLTADSELYAELSGAGVSVINIHHVRFGTHGT